MGTFVRVCRSLIKNACLTRSVVHLAVLGLTKFKPVHDETTDSLLTFAAAAICCVQSRAQT